MSQKSVAIIPTIVQGHVAKLLSVTVCIRYSLYPLLQIDKWAIFLFCFPIFLRSRYFCARDINQVKNCFLLDFFTSSPVWTVIFLDDLVSGWNLCNPLSSSSGCISSYCVFSFVKMSGAKGLASVFEKKVPHSFTKGKWLMSLFSKVPCMCKSFVGVEHNVV